MMLSENKERAYSFFREFLKAYYLRGNIPEPPRIKEREFAFYYGDTVSRHHFFVNFSELRKYMYLQIPTGIHYSAAFYLNPAAPMEKKGWKGAEMILEIDTDHIPNSSEKYLQCPFCRNVWINEESDLCKICGNKGKPFTWPTKKLIDVAKVKTLNLINILRKDFGLKDFSVYFSGHRGFHVHIRDEKILNLNSQKRASIVSYIWPENTKLITLCARGQLSTSMKGMKGRIARQVLEILNKRGTSHSGREGDNKSVNKKEICLQAMNEVAVCIDIQVASDTTHLIRMPGSVHDKTGLIVSPVDISEIKNFDPFSCSVVDARTSKGDRIFESLPFYKVKMYGVPELEISSSRKYGPYEPNTEVEVPASMALFFVLKGVGEIVGRPDFS